jgi:hypothetical protein
MLTRIGEAANPNGQAKLRELCCLAIGELLRRAMTRMPRHNDNITRKCRARPRSDHVTMADGTENLEPRDPNMATQHAFKLDFVFAVVLVGRQAATLSGEIPKGDSTQTPRTRTAPHPIIEDASMWWTFLV